MDGTRTGDGETLLLVLASRDTQTVAQLTAASHLSDAELLQRLHQLTEQGFIIADSPDAGGVCVYRLNPKGVRSEPAEPHERILLVDDASALRRVMTLVLEEEGYAVIATAVQGNAVAMLQEIAFDLVITDSFSNAPSGAFVQVADILEAAGTTPVALFSAHRLELEPALAAGFAALIGKPFDIDVLAQQIRGLLAH
jgi:CheY-like chemotaxis protein